MSRPRDLLEVTKRSEISILEAPTPDLQANRGAWYYVLQSFTSNPRCSLAGTWDGAKVAMAPEYLPPEAPFIFQCVQYV